MVSVNSPHSDVDVLTNRVAKLNQQLDQLDKLVNLHLGVRQGAVSTNIPHPTLTGGLITEGIDNTERTTQSVGTATLSTIPVSITVDKFIEIHIPWRKTTGAVGTGALGLTLNATQVQTGKIVTSNANATDDGIIIFRIGPRDSLYTHSGIIQSHGTSLTVAPIVIDGALPNATITSVVIQGNVSDALITLAVKNIRVYSWASS